MAHLGTAVQIAARGAQDGSLTGSDPGDSWFVRHVRDSPTFGEEAVEIPPLRAAAFGKTAVFPLPRDRDMLGDMFLELRLPALQPTLGTSLPPHEPPAGAYVEQPVSLAGDSVTLDAGGEVRLSLDRLTAQPVAGVRRTGGSWTWFRFEWPDGVRWDAVVDAATRVVRSTLTGPPLAQACRVSVWLNAWAELPGWKPVAGWRQRVKIGRAHV